MHILIDCFFLGGREGVVQNPTSPFKTKDYLSQELGWAMTIKLWISIDALAEKLEWEKQMEIKIRNRHKYLVGLNPLNGSQILLSWYLDLQQPIQTVIYKTIKILHRFAFTQ
jgi:hypothetical protein